MQNKVTVIAEAGVNHNGDIKMAKLMVDAAFESGADIIKFQTFVPEKLVSGSAKMADYQKLNTGYDTSQLEMLKKLTLSKKEFLELYEYCGEKGIIFLSTPFDSESIEFLDPLLGVWKIPSGEITDYPYLEAIAGTGKDIILSTGMSTIREIKAAVDLLKSKGSGRITLLHCTTSYPAPYESVNLRAMLTLKEEFHTDVGYSDHTRGIEIPIVASAMGAKIIEKHFTLDRNMEGPDHKASLEPDELSAMVKAIRSIEKALGTGEKIVTDSERANIPAVRKSIVAKRHIFKGELLTKENITTKRPGTGIPAMRWPEVIGTAAIRDFCEDELIEL